MKESFWGSINSNARVIWSNANKCVSKNNNRE